MNRKIYLTGLIAGTLLTVPGVLLAHGRHHRHDDGRGVRLATDIVNLVNAVLTPVRPVVVAPPPPPPPPVVVVPAPPPPRRVYVTPPPVRYHYRGAPPRHHGGGHRGGHRGGYRR